MCVIILSEAKPVQDSILQTSARINPHGLGVTDLNTFKTTFHASDDWKVLSGRTNYLAHFRYATVGSVCKQNTHPFRIPRTKAVLYQNGTVESMGNDKITDAEDMAKFLSIVPRSTWRTILELTECRWAIADSSKKTVDLYNEVDWHINEDSWFSKDNVLGDLVKINAGEELVAVYGTLKEDGGNDYLLDDSEMLGYGETVNKYPMVSTGIPFVFDRPGEGHNIVCEVYSVDKETLENLDRLEGHPTWYERRKTKVNITYGIYNTETEVDAWLYFCDGAPDDGNYIAEYPINRSYTSYYDGVSKYHSKPKSDVTPYSGSQCNDCKGYDTLFDEHDNALWCGSCKNYVDSTDVW